jgi:hypothetical protein
VGQIIGRHIADRNNLTLSLSRAGLIMLLIRSLVYCFTTEKTVREAAACIDAVLFSLAFVLILGSKVRETVRNITTRQRQDDIRTITR